MATLSEATRCTCRHRWDEHLVYGPYPCNECGCERFEADDDRENER